MDIHGLNPVAMMLVIRTTVPIHVMVSREECAECLRSDIKLAKTLGFSIVRVLSIVPSDVMVKALPLAEALDIRIGKEIHQLMS
ncbi:hypothetical protein KCP70_20925 [Salmonella enterica subsp. enterica]|nr:hypothetical protein KCP70_20925 [Salmonella enterica subsp. enterica]